MNKSTLMKVRGVQYGLLGVGVTAVLCLVSLHSYLLFHCIAEGFSIAVACGMFMVAWHAQKYAEKGFLK